MTDSERTQINQYIEQIARGSYTAIDSLAQMVSGRMLSVALSVVRNRALAEDVVQDSFLRILSKAATFRKGINGYAWICKIVHNTALNALRRERRFRALNYDDLPFLSDDCPTEDNLVAAAAVQQAIKELTEREKQLIYQKYFMEFTVRDSARATGISKSEVQRTVARAEAKLKASLTVG